MTLPYLKLNALLLTLFGAIGCSAPSPTEVAANAAAEAAMSFSTKPEPKLLATELPKDQNVLFWTVAQRDLAFRSMELGPPVRQIYPNHVARELPAGEAVRLDMDLEGFINDQRIAGLIVLHRGKVRLQRYGLGLDAKGKWTSFSVAKSFTSTLVGAAIQDGSIKSVDDSIALYIPELKGSAYDNVTVHQLLTMTSGVRWDENYSDPKSDVTQFNVVKPEAGMDTTVSYMRKLPRAHPPGAVWNYSTGETNLVGVLVSRATGKALSGYLSDKIWRPYGMSQVAVWNLGATGHEISGCCITAAVSDFARFGQFVLDAYSTGKIDGKPVVPVDWFVKATTKQTQLGKDTSGRGYGYQWWTKDDGTFAARGIFGQGIFIDPKRQLVIVLNGNWPRAGDGRLGAQREQFFAAVQRAVDVQ